MQFNILYFFRVSGIALYTLIFKGGKIFVYYPELKKKPTLITK